MIFYETLVMLRNSTTDSVVDELEKSIAEKLKGIGEVIKFDKWGKLRLAYPVEHKDYAYYTLVRFKLDEKHATTFAQDLDHMLKVKFNSSVIRYVTVNIEEEACMASYKKPEAFVPSSTFGSNFKDGGERGFRANNFAIKKNAEEIDPEIDLEVEEAE